MVQRAYCLVTNYNIPPESLLMITFLKEAAIEIQERIASLFSSLDGAEGARDGLCLPTVKTFHSLHTHGLQNVGKLVDWEVHYLS